MLSKIFKRLSPNHLLPGPCGPGPPWRGGPWCGGPWFGGPPGGPGGGGSGPQHEKQAPIVTEKHTNSFTNVLIPRA